MEVDTEENRGGSKLFDSMKNQRTIVQGLDQPFPFLLSFFSSTPHAPT